MHRGGRFRRESGALAAAAGSGTRLTPRAGRGLTNLHEVTLRRRSEKNGNERKGKERGWEERGSGSDGDGSGAPRSEVVVVSDAGQTTPGVTGRWTPSGVRGQRRSGRSICAIRCDGDDACRTSAYACFRRSSGRREMVETRRSRGLGHRGGQEERGEASVASQLRVFLLGATSLLRVSEWTAAVAAAAGRAANMNGAAVVPRARGVRCRDGSGQHCGGCGARRGGSGGSGECGCGGCCHSDCGRSAVQ